MRLLLFALSFFALACGAPPPCTTGASNLKISDAQGGTLYQSDAVCADWNTNALSLLFKADLPRDEKFHGLSLEWRVNPQTVGSFKCEDSELGVTLSTTIESDRSYDYSNLTSYLAGYDPGSQIIGTSCTFEVSSAPSSGTATGTFTGKLGRQPNTGDPEIVDVRFTFSVPAR